MDCRICKPSGKFFLSHQFLTTIQNPLLPFRYRGKVVTGTEAAVLRRIVGDKSVTPYDLLTHPSSRGHSLPTCQIHGPIRVIRDEGLSNPQFNISSNVYFKLLSFYKKKNLPTFLQFLCKWIAECYNNNQFHTPPPTSDVSRPLDLLLPQAPFFMVRHC